jgi:hypothetical protein
VPEDRVTLHVEPWSWSLERTARGFELSVVCGTVGLYERVIVLAPQEVQMWEDGGAAALEQLVEAIRNDTAGDAFADRYQ